VVELGSEAYSGATFPARCLRSCHPTIESNAPAGHEFSMSLSADLPELRTRYGLNSWIASTTLS
jgi:hypothetical protein